MNSKILFDERMLDINEYFDFISLLINKKPTLTYTEGESMHEQNIDIEMTHILKANTYIILYNLIEATISNAIEDIHDALRLESDVCIDQLNINLAQLAFKKMDLQIISNVDLNTNNVATIIFKEWLIAHKKLIDANKNPLFSGNVDARKVRDVASLYGFSSDTDASLTHNGGNLNAIKTARNDLAHGSDSFRDKGRETSIDELRLIKDEVYHYLNSILSNIKSYIDNKNYLRAS